MNAIPNCIVGSLDGDVAEVAAAVVKRANSYPRYGVVVWLADRTVCCVHAAVVTGQRLVASAQQLAVYRPAPNLVDMVIEDLRVA